MTQAADVAHLIRLNGGKLVGRTRLQKSAYFLESNGVGFGFDFSYHHYGPYSEELSNLADDALALKLLEIDWKTSQAGARYAVFQSLISDTNEEQDTERQKILQVLAKYTAIELELAATSDFLARNGFASDPWTETKRRKTGKIGGERLERSKKLLEEINSR